MSWPLIAGILVCKGSATTMISNPIWVVQTSQAVQTMKQNQEPSTSSNPPQVKKLSILQTIQSILENDGITAFWRGIGPAMVLVINPVLQYTVFEQLKNNLITRRTAKLRAAGAAATAVAVLTDLDFFFLGAVSKLGKPLAPSSMFSLTPGFTSSSHPVATGTTYPYMYVQLAECVLTRGILMRHA